jgi:transcriptional regulator with GAF, ATPase, and Fis domain
MVNLVKEWLINLDFLIGSYPVLLVVHCVSITLKIFIASTLLFKLRKSPVAKLFRPWALLIVVVISASIVDFAWIIKMIKEVFIPTLDYKVVLFFLRIAWGFLAIQYQALTFFIASLLEKNYKPRWFDIAFCFGSLLIFFFFIALAVFHYNCPSPQERSIFEAITLKISFTYVFFNLFLSSLIFGIKFMRERNLPKILHNQLKIFLQLLIIPYIVAECLQIYPFQFAVTWITNNYTAVSLTTLILTYTIYHCMRKVMGLRFLNLQTQVEEVPARVTLIKDFRYVIEQLGLVSSTKELQHIVQNFFKDVFYIPLVKTRFYIRNFDKPKAHKMSDLRELPKEAEMVENFITLHAGNSLDATLRQHKILVADELAFSNFYEEQEEYKTLLAFLDGINTDIFIPIYEQKTIVAYIIVERSARVGLSTTHELYNHVEQDQMLVFANYLGNIINLLQHRNLYTLIQQEKELKDELFLKHQEINQYRESMGAFLSHAQEERKIGIMFYKNRSFVYGNHVAKDMLGIDVNRYQGHPVARALKNMAQQVLEYKAPQKIFVNDGQGDKVVLSGILHLEKNNVIITTYYPEISDLLKDKLALLKDPTKWDYLLYLETTKSGRLVNQLIPGVGATLLNFKIELLKAALSKKALLLSMPEEDLIPTVEVVHYISLREYLHKITLDSPVRTFDVAINLFGVNPLLGMTQGPELALLEKLNNTGTLFIENIQYLDLETQECLAEFIKYGVFKVFKSDQKVASSVRIICSTNANLQKLLQEGKFSVALFNELRATTLTMPSLLTLPEEELHDLTSNLADQAIKDDTFKDLLELSPQEEKKIFKVLPASVHELRIKVRQFLVEKSKKHNIDQEVKLDTAYDFSDPEVAEAVRLGKEALKDSSIMGMLLKKFDGNESKIATILGVNRSSVNRRCKEHGLIVKESAE